MQSFFRTICLGLLLAAAAPCGWIWSTPGDAAPKNRFTYFRKVVTLELVPAKATLLFAADSNARLWINGQIVLRKVTRYHEDRATADTIDATPYLHPGQNVVVVLHHNWGPIITFQRSANKHAGLYVESDWLRTDASWRWLTAPEFAAHDQQIVGITGDHRIRYPQIADGRKALPASVHDAAFDDASWQHAYEVKDGPWPAAPAKNEIATQRETAVHPEHVVAAGRLIPAQSISDDPLSIAKGIRTARCEPVAGMDTASIEGRAGESRYVTFDFFRPVHGYPFIDLADAPEGTVIDFGYGEIAYTQYKGERPVHTDGWLNPEAVVGAGYADRYITRAGAQRFEVPDERTARWLTLHIHFQHDGKVTFRERGIVKSQYPIQTPGTFDAGDARIAQIVKLCLTHAELTMVDGYVDTPGREDGTWIEDARLRAVIASRWFGDSSLRRLVIRLHAESQNASGGFRCFPPSNYPIGSCGYDWSVQWVAMLHDDYMWTGQTDLITRYWEQLRRFWSDALSNVDANGIWRSGKVFGDIRVGVHPSDKQSSGIVTPYLIQRLNWSVEMAEATDHREQAVEWRAIAQKMRTAFLRDHVVPAQGAVPAHVDDVFDPQDAGALRGFSQAAQAMAAASGFSLKPAIDYAFAAPDGAPPAGIPRWNNPTFAYRALFALSENGFAERAVAHLKERYAPYMPGDARNRVAPELQGPDGGPPPEYWVSREDLGLKDGEPNPAQPVDDTGSHGWEAVPLLWLHDSLLGVRISMPGGARLTIAPQTGGLPYVSGTTMTPKGPVWLRWDGRKFDLKLPAGVAADVMLPGKPMFTRTGPALP
jgi:hypothetical protein